MSKLCDHFFWLHGGPLRYFFSLWGPFATFSHVGGGGGFGLAHFPLSELSAGARVQHTIICRLMDVINVKMWIHPPRKYIPLHNCTLLHNTTRHDTPSHYTTPPHKTPITHTLPTTPHATTPHPTTPHHTRPPSHTLYSTTIL